MVVGFTKHFLQFPWFWLRQLKSQVPDCQWALLIPLSSSEKCQNYLKILLWCSKSDWQLLAKSFQCAKAISKKLAYKIGKTEVVFVLHTSDAHTYTIQAQIYMYILYICVCLSFKKKLGMASSSYRYTILWDLPQQLLTGNT